MILKLALSTTSVLLTQGGDERIVPAQANGENRYGCASRPAPSVAAFGSSTATAVSQRGYAAADRARRRLITRCEHETLDTACDEAMNEVRQDLVELCGLGNRPGVEVILGASGTDMHLIAAQLFPRIKTGTPLIIMMDANETGSGVQQALMNGNHHSQDSVVSVALRAANGDLRPVAHIHADIEQLVERAARAHREVLLVTLDVSKTGLLLPAPAFVAQLQAHWGDGLTVMVDASQFRLSTNSLRAYLDAGQLVLITGSKFLTGPSFCGALLVPPTLTARMRAAHAGELLAQHSTRADWPRDWPIRASLPQASNIGLLLRWRAALAELRAFSKLPDGHVRQFTRLFARSIQARLAQNPAFTPIDATALTRLPMASEMDWDHHPTIFPFVLNRRDGSGTWVPLTREQTARVHRLICQDVSTSVDTSDCADLGLAHLRCQLGQPVACGHAHGSPVSALRLNLSARLVVEALSRRGEHAHTVIQRALTTLNKAAWLAQANL